MHKNDKKINIGIIGLGVGKHILENSINNKNIKYIYLFDFNKGLLKYLIKEYKSDKIICYSKYSNSNNKLNLSVLDYCIKRCKKSIIKNIILCTSRNKNDNIFENYSK